MGNEIILALQIAVAILTAYFAFRRLKPQILLDGSQTAVNLLTVVDKLQENDKKKDAQIASMKMTIDGLEDTINHSDLEMRIKIKIGEAPIITSYSWQKREETIPVIQA